jgi:hypothetical protein
MKQWISIRWTYPLLLLASTLAWAGAPTREPPTWSPAQPIPTLERYKGSVALMERMTEAQSVAPVYRKGADARLVQEKHLASSVRLPNRADLHDAVTVPLDRLRVRVAVSLDSGELWVIRPGHPPHGVKLEVRGEASPTRRQVQEIARAGYALTEQHQLTYELPESLIIDLDQERFFFRYRGHVYELNPDEATFNPRPVREPLPVTRRPPGEALQLAQR